MAQISRLRYRNGKCRHNADLRGIARATVLSRATMRNIRQNLAFAFSYNALGIPVAAGVLYPVFSLLLSPVFAGAAMALSSVSVVTNALRLIAPSYEGRNNKGAYGTRLLPSLARRGNDYFPALSFIIEPSCIMPACIISISFISSVRLTFDSSYASS